MVTGTGLRAPRRIALTGATGDFGRSMLQWALANDDVVEVTALGRRPTGRRHPKLREAFLDLSGAVDLAAVAGYDALVHLAYAVEEPHDKRRALRVNVGATRALLAQAGRVGIGHLVLTSSANALGVAACGTGRQYDEDAYPAGDENPGNYYFHHKALLEHLANWHWTHAAPDEIRLAVARPCYVVGAHYDNSGLRAFRAKVVPFPQPARSFYQFLWETDLVEAYATILRRGLTGIHNIAPVDQTSVEEIAEITGARVIALPSSVVSRVADVSFRLRLSPVSSHWVTLGDPLLDSGRLRSSTAWQPTATSSDALRRYVSVVRPD